MIFRAGGQQQHFLHHSRSGSITLLPVFDCGCRAPSRTSESWLIDHLLAWSIFNAPFDKITFSRVRDFTLLGRRSSEKTGSLSVLLHEGTAFRGPRSSCLADSCDFFSEMFYLSHRVCGSDHTTAGLSHYSCLQTRYCTNYVDEKKNTLIWIKPRSKKSTDCFPCITRAPTK